MSEEPLLQKLREVIDRDASTPLNEIVEEITQEHQKLHQRLNKISHISDGYQEQLRESNHKLQQANLDLTHALTEVHTLRGLIPVCARCKRIRDDHGLLDQIETYLAQHSEAAFDHGMCPDCAKILSHTPSPAAQSPSPEPPHRGLWPEETAIKTRLEVFRKDPVLKDHPLMVELEWLGAKHLRLIRRLMKISRISDGFQHELKDLNIALQESSRTDYLTGLSNRRDMMERLKAEMSRADRGRLPLALLMADVDRFKSVNDTFGHDAGDLLLQTIATNLRRALREYDVCSRWGGEEFLVLLPETSLEDASVAGEKLLERVSRIALNHEGRHLGATISLGLASYRGGETLTSLLQRADEAMYEAKRLGRNRMEVASPPGTS